MAQDARDYVAQLYQQELGRTGDAALSDPGLQAWADAIASGAMSREAVQQAIAGSQEGVRYDIGAAYERELGAGRATSGDPGMQQWVNAVTGGGMTTQQAIDQIARSQEAARYDIGREYTGTLKREGTYEQMAAKDPGIAQWEQALMNGSVTEQQFRNAVLQSQEYKALQGTTTPGTTTPKEDPNLKIIQDLKNTIAANQKLFDAQQAASAEQKKAWELMVSNASANQAAITSGYQRQIQPLQQSLLSTNATENATRGFFSPSLATYSPVAASSPATTGATTPGAAGPIQGFQAPPVPTYAAPTGPATSIAPAPGYFVPQTYLAPPPPQYRNVNPFTPMFGSSFSAPTSPFESDYNIATRRLGYPSPNSGQQGQGYQTPYIENAPAGASTI